MKLYSGELYHIIKQIYEYNHVLTTIAVIPALRVRLAPGLSGGCRFFLSQDGSALLSFVGLHAIGLAATLLLLRCPRAKMLNGEFTLGTSLVLEDLFCVGNSFGWQLNNY